MNLTCQTDSSSPASKIAWYIDGNMVSNEAKSSQIVSENGGLVTSQVLEFIPTREIDGQVVECMAINPLSQKTGVYSSVTLDLKCKFTRSGFRLFHTSVTFWFEHRMIYLTKHGLTLNIYVDIDLI